MFNPAKASSNIKEEFIDYIATTHAFANSSLQEQFVKELRANIARGPLLEIKDVFKSGKSIEEMIEDSDCPLSPLFRELEAGKPNDKLHKHKLPITRNLYLHQEKAIRAIVGGNNAVVSTGTGSGKTNCFLIPVLNELLREKEQGTLGKGVRALFIYPMNALANDQMKNIREILMCYPDITFGAYNGGTENDEESAIAVYEAMFAKEKVPELRHRLPNEILSRDEMKKNPPNILFTNYAMLEHLLLRPKDDVLFSNADFRFVVLDEAHIYTGATGIETSILLRRLKARISATKDTRFILTSATLGSDSSVDDDIITFAENLCGVSFDKKYIIRAEREPYVPNATIIKYPNELYEKLADGENFVWQVLNDYGFNVDKATDEKELLYDFLLTSDLYHALRLRLGGICELSEIGEKLSVSMDVAIAFISLCTRAQKNKKSLIDARYHFFIRSLEGCYITLNGDKRLFLNRQRTYWENGKESAVFGAAVCDDCGRIALVGKIESRRLVQASKLEEEVEYYYLGADDNVDIEDDDIEDETDGKKEVFYLCPICGAIVAENEIHNLPCDCGKENYIKVIKAKILKIGARCGNCHTGHYKRLYLGNDAATAVLATSLYEELPEIEYVESEEQTKAKNIFARAATANKKVARKTGRQFLAFSDSRQEAAKFACYLGKSYYKSNRLYYVCSTLGISEDRAIEFLTQYFEYLSDPECGNPYCMDDLNKDGTYVLRAKHFVVKINGSPDAHWYRCKKCGKTTQFNLGHCPSVRCEGKLVEIMPDDITKDNHFAKLYMSDRMSPLLIKEHTAQLSKKESAEYQEQFIKKEINALSCSTTFEMGVDVGDLETVFLRDVPPLPSNYAQRAGRAGRSLDAAAFVLTFAKLSSHDLAFFKDPKRMIGGTILPPLFKVDNEKIVRRHIYAVALSIYFADHEDQYNHNDADKFINQKGYEGFIEWINSHPKRLLDMLKASIPDLDNLHKRLDIDDFSWIEEFSGTEGVFTQLIQEYETNIQNFEKLIKQFKRENDLAKAAMCERKLQHYKKNKLIDFLARGNILPRYGFPVNTVELQQNTTANNVSKLRLSRDLQIAIAEYAPSSEVVADGRLYTSRYIKKSATGKDKQDWYTGYIGVCRNKDCNTVNYSITPITSEGIPCSACGRKLFKMDFYESIEPRSGFVAERQDRDVPMTRQEKNYRSEDYYIGNVAARTIDKHRYLFNSIEIQVESTTNDSLMVKSVSNFYVCPLCGFAVAEDEGIGEKEIEKQMRDGALSVTTTKSHESLYGQYNCNCHELVRRSLHHEFKTDVAKISFKCNTSDYNTMVSVMYAILNAMAKDLNIERRDIKACLSAKLINGILDFSIVIYDSVPGGAGHSRRLVTKDGKMLHSIFMSALRSMSECNCEPSCYNCLRSYENQKIHDLLDRKLAIEFLQQFVGTVETVEEDEDTDPIPF